MILSAAGLVQTIVQATLLLSVSALLVRGLIGLSRCVSANTQRIVWFLVLLQGIILVPLPSEYPLARFVALAAGDGEHGPGRNSVIWLTIPARAFSTADALPSLADPFGRPGGRELSCDHGNVRSGCSRPCEHLARRPLALGLGPGFVRRRRAVALPSLPAAASNHRESRGHLGPRVESTAGSRDVRRPILFRVSCDVGPALIRRPSGYQVVVPEAAWKKLTSGQRRLILCHEFAHYEQGDLWRLLAVRLLALPHWFNPLSWWVVRKFEECTEWLCDGAAANASDAGASAIEYARALMQLGSSPFPQTSWVGAAQGSRLFHRIQRLISNSFTEDSKMKRFVLVSLALGLLLLGSVSHSFGGQGAVGNASAGQGVVGRGEKAGGKTVTQGGQKAPVVAGRPECVPRRAGRSCDVQSTDRDASEGHVALLHLPRDLGS